jgi:hypothetical protein
LRTSISIILLRAALLWFVTTGAAFGASGQLRAQGAELVLQLEDGRILKRDALVGLKLVLAGQTGETEIRIDAVEEDAGAVGGPIPLYRLSLVNPADPASADFCQPDAYGRRAGFPLSDGAGGFRLTCTSGAEGKCVLMGYRPWEATEDIPMRDLHRACVHMLRADYGGDDHPSTRNGTVIDIFDRFGIQRADRDGGMQFEAAWGRDGALCVAHACIAENISLEDIGRRYPALAGFLGPASCNEDAMKAEPRALLFNRSPAPMP